MFTHRPEGGQARPVERRSPRRFDGGHGRAAWRKGPLIRGAAAVVASAALLAGLLITAGGAPASGSTNSNLSAAQAQAAQIENEITTTGARMDALSQQYDGAVVKVQQLDTEIGQTRQLIATRQVQVARATAQLRAAAVKTYMDGDSAGLAGDLFDTNESQAAVTEEYAKIAAVSIDTVIDSLRTAENQLQASETTLASEQVAAKGQEATATAAIQQTQALQVRQDAALSQVKGQIATDIAIQKAAAERAAQAAAQAALARAQQQAAAQAAAQQAAAQQAATGGGGGSTGGGGGSTGGGGGGAGAPAPLPSGGGSFAAQARIAIAAAEREIGVPYSWGGGNDSGPTLGIGSGANTVGFDCSGLVEYAWAQAGVYFPHYSGAQYAETTHVPLSDIQPGDLLFYGPDGDTHVAMYIGGGQMIQAPETGEDVSIAPLFLGGPGLPFAGVGQPA
jgi:cell wall-associated NlpC family hydrolase